MKGEQEDTSDGNVSLMFVHTRDGGGGVVHVTMMDQESGGVKGQGARVRGQPGQ